MTASGASTKTPRKTVWVSATKPTQDTPETLNSRRVPRMCWILCYSGALAAHGSLELYDLCLWLVMLPEARIPPRSILKYAG